MQSNLCDVTFTFVGSSSERLINVLFRNCREHFVSHAHCTRIITKGRVLIDGGAATLRSMVTPGQQITLQPTHEVQQVDGVRRVVYYEKLTVVMQNDEWAAVVKPPGLPMDASWAKQGGKSACVRTLASMLPYSLTPSSSEDALAVPVAVHRLDASVGGVLLVAMTRGAARRLAWMFRSRRVRKTYVTVVKGCPEAHQGDVVQPIDGKPSLSRYRVISTQPSLRFGALTKMEIEPLTGRTHQLRRHCAEALGCPIVGDMRYGGESVRCAQSLYLYATSIELLSSESSHDHLSIAHSLEADDGDNELHTTAECSEAMTSSPPRGEDADDAFPLGRVDVELPTKFDRLIARDKKAWEMHQSGEVPDTPRPWSLATSMSCCDALDDGPTD